MIFTFAIFLLDFFLKNFDFFCFINIYIYIYIKGIRAHIYVEKKGGLEQWLDLMAPLPLLPPRPQGESMSDLVVTLCARGSTQPERWAGNIATSCGWTPFDSLFYFINFNFNFFWIKINVLLPNFEKNRFSLVTYLLGQLFKMR